MISGWNKKFLHWVTDYTRSKVLSPQWPVWPKTSALFFSLSGFHFFLNQSLLQFEDFLSYFILIEDKLCSYRVLFFFSLLLYFSLFYYGWADTIGAALVSLHFWLFNMLKSLAWSEYKNFQIQIFKFFKLIVSHCECLTSFSIKASKFIRSLSFKPKNK